MELIDVDIPKSKLTWLVKNGYFVKNKNGTYSTTPKFTEYLKKWTEDNAQHNAC